MNNLIAFEKLNSIVEIEINKYNEQNIPFCFVVIEFLEHCDKLFSKDEIISLFVNDLDSSLRPNLDFYTVDKSGRVIIMFSEIDFIEVQEHLEKIYILINEIFGSAINFCLSLLSYPEDAFSYKDLMLKANVQLLREKEKKITFCQDIKSLNEIKIKSLLKRENVDVNTLIFEKTQKLVCSLKEYDNYFYEHSSIVARGSVLLAKEAGLPWAEVENVAVASLLHDIGYLMIPKTVFQKQGELSQDDWIQVKLHPLIAVKKILEPMEIFGDYLQIILGHHEFIDGTGYPYGLKGDKIKAGSQIISILDSFHAMSVDRPYRKALPIDQILDVYIKKAGIKWNSELITTFCAMICDEDTRFNILNTY
ncbi:MAG: HD domain-containing phosphohydrolase [bacterium]